MNDRWRSEERVLWDQMMYPRYRMADNRKWAKILAKARNHGGKEREQAVKKRLGLLTQEEAVARSWQAYRNWVEH